MQVGPEYAARHMPHRGYEQMMIVPVNANHYETQHVREHLLPHVCERAQIVPIGRAKLQHHDRDYYRDYAVAERFQTRFAHVGLTPSLMPAIVTQSPTTLADGTASQVP